MRTSVATLLAIGLAVPPALAWAHTAWLEPGTRAGEFTVLYGGHEGKQEPYAVDRVESVAAFDVTGKPLDVTTRTTDDLVRVTTSADVAMLALAFDNGYWSRDPDGASLNVPMNEVPGATQGTHALKYSKTVMAWGDAVRHALGQRYELVPLDAGPPRAGQGLRVRVLLDGKPLAGAAVSVDESAAPVHSDADGVATVVPVPGRNAVWSGHRLPVADDPRATVHSFEYVLVFDAP